MAQLQQKKILATKTAVCEFTTLRQQFMLTRTNKQHFPSSTSPNRGVAARLVRLDASTTYFLCRVKMQLLTVFSCAETRI